MTVHQWLATWSSWGWPLLANHLWQSTLLSVLAFGAARALRNGPARARFVVWLMVSAKFALPAALLVPFANRIGLDFSSLLASSNGSNEGTLTIFQFTAPVTQSGQATSINASPGDGHVEFFCALTIVWLAGCVVLVAMWLRRLWQFRLALQISQLDATIRERQALSRVRTWLGIRRDVGLSIVPSTIEPAVWGVWAPIILLPESIGEELSDAELEAVLMHEMIHVARWDNLTANLHRLLCCLLWFHPIVWMLDRLLLTEREQACDEEVIRLGGAGDVYASSLLKVLRFCIGWRVAGLSNATGSNLIRRVERIMSKSVPQKLSTWQRTAIGSIIALVAVLSMAAALLPPGGVVAQSAKARQGAAGGVPGGIAGGVTGGVPGGVPGGVRGGIEDGIAGIDGQGNLIERLDQAEEVAVEFKNSAKSPLVIVDAKVRAVPREKDGAGDEFAVVPVVTLSNNTDRRIRGVCLQFRSASERRIYYEEATRLIEPHAIYTSSARKRLMLLRGRPEGWSVRVSGVLFEDGELWGAMPPPPPPPPPPAPPVSASGSDAAAMIRKSGGVLTSSATHRVDAEYPAPALAARITGSVVVEVTVDEGGAVISARALSGHPLLKDAAVNAARQWQFNPTMLSGVPVKVIGTLTFYFEP